ncbi:MAG: CrcB family protein, partial [Steroidobacteraceae bacterium]|nr:CrcB family protein [Steroidobacteraceae bacterium]MDW8259170.1 CrcB family protein [Gammaproteobacteria bacterium]
AWPGATLLVNVLGCFAIGVCYAWLIERGDAPLALRHFWMTGVLGGFTTWSAFALEANVLSALRPVSAALYVLLTVIACLLAVWAGRWVANQF